MASLDCVQFPDEFEADFMDEVESNVSWSVEELDSSADLGSVRSAWTLSGDHSDQ